MTAPKLQPTLWTNIPPGNGNYGVHEEGAYLSCASAAPGAANAYSITTAFSDTTPFLYVANPGSPGSLLNPSIYLDVLKIIVTTVPASTVAIHYACVLDNTARALGTDNTLAAQVSNPNGGFGPLISPTVKFQASATASVITASSANKRFVGRGMLGGLPIVGDELQIVFGQHVAGTVATTAAEGAGEPGARVASNPGIIIPPGFSLTMHLWLASNAATGLSYEAFLGMFAR